VALPHIHVLHPGADRAFLLRRDLGQPGRGADHVRFRRLGAHRRLHHVPHGEFRLLGTAGVLERINEMLVGPNGGVIVSVFSFLFMAALVLAIGFIVLPLFERRRALAEAVAEAGAGGARSLAGRRELSRVKASRPVESFFRATEKSEGLPDGLELRLFQAGFYSPNAVLYYNISRLAFVAVGFFAAYLLFSVVVPDTLPAFVP